MADSLLCLSTKDTTVASSLVSAKRIYNFKYSKFLNSNTSDLIGTLNINTFNTALIYFELIGVEDTASYQYHRQNIGLAIIPNMIQQGFTASPYSNSSSIFFQLKIQFSTSTNSITFYAKNDLGYNTAIATSGLIAVLS